MNLKEYILEKVKYILLFFIYHIFLYMFLIAMGLEQNEIMIIIIVNAVIAILCLIHEYSKHKRYFYELDKIMEKLKERYLITEVMEKPKTQVELYYYEMLKKANKSMMERVNKIENSQKEYQEYIESWIHEIKIPIASAMLFCENNKTEITRKIYIQLEEINNYVEQALFYARKEKVSNDYIIKSTMLSSVIDTVIARNKQLLIQNNIQIQIEYSNIIAYTDEKWLEFVLNQIIINCIKYKNKEQALINIQIKENEKNVEIIITDNGMGIKQSEIGKVFEKGFTGTNGRKVGKKSTGIGLYLCKNLCEKLEIELKIESKENEYTKVILIIPKLAEWKEINESRNLTKF